MQIVQQGISNIKVGASCWPYALKRAATCRSYFGPGAVEGPFHLLFSSDTENGFDVCTTRSPTLEGQENVADTIHITTEAYKPCLGCT